MEQDKLTSLTPNSSQNGEGGEKLLLAAEEGTTLSSGNIRLYGQLLPSPFGEGPGVRLVGCLDLYNYDPLNHRVAVGIMVAKEYRRQGYALAMLDALERSPFIVQHSSLHSLYADIAATNTVSLALFRKAGYEECGHFRDWLYVDGKYIDSIRMQKIL